MTDTTYVLSASAISRRFMTSVTAQRRTGRFAAGTYLVLGATAALTGVRIASAGGA